MANFANLSTVFFLTSDKLLLIYLHDPAHTQNILHLLSSSKPYLSFKAQGIHYLLLSLSSSYLLSCLSSIDSFHFPVKIVFFSLHDTACGY